MSIPKSNAPIRKLPPIAAAMCVERNRSSGRTGSTARCSRRTNRISSMTAATSHAPTVALLCPEASRTAQSSAVELPARRSAPDQSICGTSRRERFVEVADKQPGGERSEGRL